jgi:hypothetical protein
MQAAAGISSRVFRKADQAVGYDRRAGLPVAIWCAADSVDAPSERMLGRVPRYQLLKKSRNPCRRCTVRGTFGQRRIVQRVAYRIFAAQCELS